MVASFFKYLEFERRYSRHTLTSYRNDLNQFEDYLQGLVKIEAAEHGHIRGWLIEMVNAGLSPASINRKVASLRSFYKYALRNELIDKDPCTKIKALKTGKSLPVFAKEQELTKVLDHMIYKEGFQGCRDQMVMEFLYGTGTRLSEMINLLETDVDMDRQQVKVLGKRNKQRIIPLPRSLVGIIEEYKFKKREEFQDNYSPYLIVNNNGGKGYPMMIYRIVQDKLKSVESLEKHSPHILRHTFATHLLNKGAELNAVKELLGHTSLAATQVYTHNSIERLREVFKQSHPKA